MNQPPRKRFPDDYDPPEDKREYYRHIITGDRGFWVKRNGKDCIRYDQPKQDRTVPFLKHNWIPVDENRCFPDMTLAQIAFDADKRICAIFSKIDIAKSDWMRLRDEERIEFLEQGPPADPPIRKKVYQAIMGAIEELRVKK